MTAYERLNLIASYGGLALIYYGFREMARGADMRAADSNRKRDEAMAESRRKHDEAMAKHDKAMIDSERRHAEAMTALRELIDGRRKAAWPCARSSSEPGKRPGRGIASIPHRTPQPPLSGGLFFHPPLVRARCLYPLSRG